jgi:serine/threonine-protein kinase
VDIVSATAESIEIEGFGTSAEPFIRLLTDFQQEHGIEPDIGVRLLDERQCPAITFLHEMSRAEGVQPTLKLDKDVLEYGGAIAGTITDAGGRNLWLILVDHRGRFYNLTGLLQEQADGAFRFGIQLSGGAENAPPTPQLMMVVASDIPLQTTSTATNRVDDITAIVRAEINQKGVAANASAAYFRFENQ